MRVSTRMMSLLAIQHLRGRQDAVALAEARAASGRRVASMSDDPVDATAIMRAEATLRDLDRYRRNGASATTRMAVEDQVLTSVGEALQRTKELARAAAIDDPNDPMRLAALEEVGRIRAQLVALGNTQVGDEYVFGGTQTGSPPFLADGTYVGDSGTRDAEIDGGVRVKTNDAGDAFLTGALQAVIALEQQLTTGNAAGIKGTTPALELAQREAAGVQAGLGSRLLQIRQTAERLGQRSVDLIERRNALREADPAQSLLELRSAQAALERAYAAIGRVVEIDIIPYLR